MASADEQGPTQQEIATTQVSWQQWQDYKSRFQPAEQAMIKRSEFTAGEQAQVEGMASADTAQAFKGLARSTVAAAAGAGAKVNSGKAKMSLAGDATAHGAARGLARGAAVTGGEIDESMQKLKITATGRGIAADVTADMAQGARRASRLAEAAADAKFMRNTAIMDTVAAVGGAATRKWGNKLFSGDLEEIDTTELSLKYPKRFSTPQVGFGFGEY